MRYPLRSIVAVVAVAAGLAIVAPAGANPQLAGLQVALAREGLYTGPVDAVPGPITHAALQAFQRHAGLVPDGIVGPMTRHALGSFARPLFGTRVMKPGMRGWDVAVLQFLLSKHRLLATRPNGEFGARTESAVVRFQRARGLEPDGVVGPLTARKLCKLAVCAWKATTEPSASSTAPVSVESLLDRWASYYGVDPHLVRGLAWQESGYQPSVVSQHGAVGVMQITPDTWAFVEAVLIGHPVAPTVDGNVQVGVAYLHYLIGLFGGDTTRAVAAYYQGPHSVVMYGISDAARVYVNDVLALSRRL
jgi:hypothetical protein